MPLKFVAPHSRFEEIFGLPKALADEASLGVSAKGLRMILIDDARVRVVKFSASPSAFGLYEFSPPTMEEEVYGINLEKIAAFIKNTKKVAESAQVEMTLPSQPGQMVLKCGRVKLVLALLANVKAPKDVPPIEKTIPYLATCVIRGKDFKAFSEAASTLADSSGTVSVDLLVKDGKLTAVSQGNVDRAEIEVGPASPYLKEDGTKADPEGAHSTFSVDLLVAVCNALPAREITFKLANDAPLVAQYSDDGVDVFAMLAPRVGEG